jgi:hypothetical protein
VIANLSPVEESAHESLCTLRFASMVDFPAPAFVDMALFSVTDILNVHFQVGSCELGKAVKHTTAEKHPADEAGAAARPQTAEHPRQAEGAKTARAAAGAKDAAAKRPRTAGAAGGKIGTPGRGRA